MKNNIHISLTPFRNESRVLKETASLVRAGLVQHVYIVALHEEGLREIEEIDVNRSVWRVRLRVRKWSHSLWAQLVKYLELCIRVICFARKKNIELVNIHHLDLLPLGVLLKLSYGAKIVYDTHELETERHGLSGQRQVIARYVERFLIRHVDLVIVVSDSINSWYRDTYRLSNVTTVLNCPEYQKNESTKLLHVELRIPECKKILIYQGGLSNGRGLLHLLNVFAKHNDGRHVLVLMGDGDLEGLVKKYVADYDNIYYRESVAPTEVLKYSSSADVGISFIENTSLSYYWCLPNKIFEYIMAGLPVVVSNLPEMRSVVDECCIGVVLDELTSISLSRALEAITQINDLKNNVMRAASKYSWENQERVMLDGYRKHI